MFELIIDTEVRGGPTESALTKAKVLADAELRQRARPDERAWLSANPILWLRALTYFAEETRLHIGNQRLRIKAIPCPDGRRPPERIAAEEKLLPALHFLKRCEERIAEVAVLIGPDQLGVLTGDVLAMLLRISALLRTDRIEEAEDTVNGAIGLVAKNARLGPPPDNSGAAPIKLVVRGLTKKTRINCRACGRAKVDPHQQAPRCPLCRQEHLISR